MSIAMIQLAIIGLCVLYILASISFKQFKKRIYRACIFIFVLAGFISYIIKGSSWLNFLEVLVPIMILYQFEHRFTK